MEEKAASKPVNSKDRMADPKMEAAGGKTIKEATMEDNRGIKMPADGSDEVFFETDFKTKRITYFGDIDKFLGYMPNVFPRTLEAKNKVVHPEDRQRLTKALEESLRTGKPLSEEYRIIKKDGTVAYWSEHSTAIYGKGGVPARWVGFISDVTAKKKVQEPKEPREVGDMEGADGIVVMMDNEGTILHFNEYAERFFGYSREEVVGKSAYDTILPRNDSSGRDLGQLVHRIASDRKYALNINENMKKGGERVWVRWHNSPILGKGGQQEGTLCIGQEITERMERTLQGTLQELKELESIVNRSQVVMFLWRNEDGGTIEYVSENIKQFGYSQVDMISGKLKYGDIIHEGDLLRVSEEAMKYSREGRDEFRQTYRIVTSKGEDRWVDSMNWARRGVDGRITHYQGIILDITDRKKAEEEWKKSVSLLTATIESTADGIIVLDWSGRVVIFNRKFVNMWRIPDSVMATKDNDRLIEYVQDQLKNPEQLLKTREVRLYSDEDSKIIEFKDGRVFERYQHPQQVGDQIIGLVVSFRDITKLRKAEEELKRYTEQLEELVEEKTKQLRDKERLATIGETATMVGHDLRNPLQVIINKLYIARLIFDETPRLDNYTKRNMVELVDALEKQVNYMNKIVSDLQDYARDVKPKLDNVSFVRLVTNALSMVNLPEGISYEVDSDERLEICADLEMMTRVIINLTSNAIQAMPDGGRLKYAARNDGGRFVIKISDTGVGIPEENMKNMFLPLFTTKSKGMGFGLAVCKRIVEGHGGTITVESVVGGGTTFIISLPIERP